LTIDLSEDEDLKDRIQSWSRNRSFIGLTSWPEEEEEDKSSAMLQQNEILYDGPTHPSSFCI